MLRRSAVGACSCRVCWSIWTNPKAIIFIALVPQFVAPGPAAGAAAADRRDPVPDRCRGDVGLCPVGCPAPAAGCIDPQMIRLQNRGFGGLFISAGVARGIIATGLDFAGVNFRAATAR